VWSIQQLVDLPALLLLIAANATPVVLARMLGRRYATAIDAGFSMHDGRPLFGPHKTWRGLIAGMLAGATVGSLLSPGLILGGAFAALALLGDLLSSFLKRRLGFASGAAVPLLDQLPEALLPLLILHGPLGLESVAVIGTALAFTGLDMIAARYRL